MRLLLSGLTFCVLIHYVAASVGATLHLKDRSATVTTLQRKFPELREASDINAASAALMRNSIDKWEDWVKIWDAFMLSQPEDMAFAYLGRFSASHKSGYDSYKIVLEAMARIIRDHRQSFFSLIAKASFEKFKEQCQITTSSTILEQIKQKIEEDIREMSQDKEIVDLFKSEPALYVVFTLDSKVESLLLRFWWDRRRNLIDGSRK